MVDTFQAVGVTLLAVLPGAVYTWAFERQVGRWGIGLADRSLRFVGVSAAFLAAYAYPLYLLWTHYLHVPTLTAGRLRFENLVSQGGHLPWWLFLVPAIYAAIPFAAGSFVGWTVHEKKPWARWLAGRAPAPRAWDYLFFAAPAGVVRLSLKQDGAWIGGLFGGDSYASGYPETQELYLETTYRMNADGSFATTDEGGFEEVGSGLLIRWDEILNLEFFHREGG